jgi:hypothetical protein
MPHPPRPRARNATNPAPSANKIQLLPSHSMIVLLLSGDTGGVHLRAPAFS